MTDSVDEARLGADVLAASLDLDALAQCVRSLAPGCNAAMLVGSAVTRFRGPVADLDVTGLDPAVPAGDDVSVQGSFDGWPLHVVLYDPAHFVSVLRSDDLFLLFAREMRKLLDGILLFDDGSMAASVEGIRSVSPPLERLRAMAEGVLRWTPAGSEIRTRLSLYQVAETMCFTWMHLDMAYRFTKHKWLMDDAELVPSRYLVPLLAAMADELTSVAQIEELVDAVSTAAGGLPGEADHHLVQNVRDARSLLSDGHDHAAVWPLRMSAYRLARSYAAAHGLPYQDLTSVETLLSRHATDASIEVLSKTLLLDRPVPPHVVTLFESARREFEDELSTRTREGATP